MHPDLIFDYLLLLILSFLPMLYKFSFWLYTIQLKEYRWDRFREYLSTQQGKSAVLNFWFLLELPLFLWATTVYFDRNLELIIYPVIFYYFIVFNIFVLWKIFRKKILLPKLTFRLALTILLLIFGISSGIYYLIDLSIFNYIYSYLFFILLTAPLIIFFIILLTLPLVNYLKNKKINYAKIITKSALNPIKIWITWSYWKSSVKEYLSSILSQEWKTLSTPENINTELWVSNIILKNLTNTFKYFIAEMWAYKVWEIRTLWEIVDQKYGFLTAIWNQHIWLFWNLENIKKWKSEIQESIIKNKWILYVNWNCENIRKNKFSKELKIVKYWNYSWSDAKYKIIKTSADETEFEFNYKNISTKIKIGLIWEHQILNLIWTLAFCFDLWFKITDIKQYIQKLKIPKHTLQIIKKWKKTFIDDTHNLSKEGLLAWLNILKNYSWEKILVVDDILELGKEAKQTHIDIWKKIAEEKIVDKVIFCWTNYYDYFIEWLNSW